jgi:hypothetical protein
MRLLPGIFLFAAAAIAQDRFLSAGASAGVDFRETLASTNAIQPVECGLACLVQYSVPARKPLLFGPAVEARITKGFAIEADALYQRISYSSVFEMARPSSGLLFAFSKTTASRWQVPILLKRRFGRFFVLAGGALDGLAGVHSETDYGGREFISGRVSSGHLSSDDTGQITKGPRAGVVVGGGVELRAGGVHIAPQLRFTRWVKRRFVAEPGLRSNQSEVGLFLSLTL